MADNDWRKALPWWDSFAIPRAESDEEHCRAINCPDTNWGGSDRIHYRDTSCPPLDQAKELSQATVDFAAEQYEKKNPHLKA
jgi:hypothetical protein